MHFGLFILFYFIYIEISNTAIKKKLNSASSQANKLINELPERREKLKTQVQFRHNVLESQKRINYQNEFDRLQGAKKYQHYNLM